MPAGKQIQQLHRIVEELYGFIVTELDPHPAPIDRYLTDPDLKALAREICPHVPEGWAAEHGIEA